MFLSVVTSCQCVFAGFLFDVFVDIAEQAARMAQRAFSVGFQILQSLARLVGSIGFQALEDFRRLSISASILCNEALRSDVVAMVFLLQ